MLRSIRDNINRGPFNLLIPVLYDYALVCDGGGIAVTYASSDMSPKPIGVHPVIRAKTTHSGQGWFMKRWLMSLPSSIQASKGIIITHD